MDGEHYMKWNYENEQRPDWHKPYEHIYEETIKYTENNIKEIDNMATLMTMDEIEAFIEDDYSYLLMS